MKYFFDENFSPKLARAMNELDAKNEIFSSVDVFKRGLPDELLIPKIGEQKGILITQDFRIHKTRHLYQLYTASEIGAFFFKFPNGTTFWEINTMVVKNWTKIIKTAEDWEVPFGFRITMNRGRFERL